MLTLLASFAQEESRSASENQKWRIQKMFEEGRPNTGTMLGYRLVDGTLQIVPEEAEIVKMIFADFLAGMGRNAIMKKLNRMGIPAPHGGQWGENVIYSVLHNDCAIIGLNQQALMYQAVALIWFTYGSK